LKRRSERFLLCKKALYPKDMEKNGVQLGEMNMLLLKKIEELTLYVIELKKEVSELKGNKPSNK
jgi:hypothetical protein